MVAWRHGYHEGYVFLIVLTDCDVMWRSNLITYHLLTGPAHTPHPDTAAINK